MPSTRAGDRPDRASGRPGRGRRDRRARSSHGAGSLGQVETRDARHPRTDRRPHRPVTGINDAGRRLARAVAKRRRSRIGDDRRTGPCSADPSTADVPEHHRQPTMSLLDTVKRANRPGPPEHSIQLRVASGAAVLISVVACYSQHELSWFVTVARLRPSDCRNALFVPDAQLADGDREGLSRDIRSRCVHVVLHDRHRSRPVGQHRLCRRTARGTVRLGSRSVTPLTYPPGAT